MSYGQREGWVRDARGRWVRVRTGEGPAPTRPTPAVRPTPTPPPKPTFSRPRLLWKTLVRRSDAPPVLDGDAVYVTAGEAVLHLDEGGRLQGQATVGPTQSPPALDPQRLYLGSERGTVYAVRRDNYEVAWKFTGTGGAVRCGAAVGAGRVVFECADSLLYAFDPAGNLKWKFDRSDGALGYAAPVVAGKALYACGDTTLYRIDPGGGKEMWKAVVGGKSLSTPAVGGGLVVVGGDGTGLSAYAEANGKRIWRTPGIDHDFPPDWFGAPLVVGKSVYVATYRRRVYALERDTGKPRWIARLLGNALAAPALDAKRGALYVATATFRDNPTLTALDATTGRKLWDAKLGYLSASPVIAGDRLYVTSTTGYLYAYALD